MILDILKEAKLKPFSHNFLKGFPYDSTKWYKVVLSRIELENTLLFWEGNAWNEDGHKSCRSLREGVDNFIEMDNMGKNNRHLRNIKEKKAEFERGSLNNDTIYLILAQQATKKTRGPIMIIDGNHRAAAALWYVIERNDNSQLPLIAWLARSPIMDRYYEYTRTS